ncbi:hypothetical protein RhiirA4_481266 [Rhizophagus irregularis]|uniref:Uncharacterized protein n=1 Tax=Rhizophagus irregularis TaxID=588596 RepID=A0A2I1HJ78_9GLOM|nr:hypothetical protein RhiirA4_481266 [Rhizophagus irregularis]
MEFINAPIGHNNLIVKSHSQAFYTKETQRLKFLELKQKDAEQNLIKLETIAEVYYQSSQNELEEKQLTCQNIQMELRFSYTN